MRGEVPLSRYLDALNFQETCYPANYNKLRFLENHDQPRIASLVRDERALVNDTAMLYFLKGTTLLYAGQEFENDHLPSLFDLDPIDRRTGHDLRGLLRRLSAVKHQLGSADALTVRGQFRCLYRRCGKRYPALHGRAGDPPRGGLSVYRSTRASSGFIVSAARRIASPAGRASTFGSMTSTEQGPS